MSAANLADRAAGALDRLRASRPRVHCLMNTVAQKLVADGLSALGAIPSMTSSAEEVPHFVRHADALLVNLGTLDAGRREAIGLALDAAGEAGRRWTLDPAHCDYSPPRAVYAAALLARAPAVLRANAAEHDMLAAPAGTVSVRTGEADRVACGGKRLTVENGHPLMARVTGTGCLSGAVTAAFLAVEDDAFVAAASAMLAIGVAAEMAAEAARGPGSFEPALLDALAALGSIDIVHRARIGHGEG
jgi:hydroxyethylthiazole kinase